MIKKTKTSQQVSQYIKDFLEDHPVYSDFSLHDMSKEPWVYDALITEEEAMVWKMKGVCHVCGIDPHYHRDDCPWSYNQLMFAELDRVDKHTLQIDLAVGNILSQLKK